MSDWRCILRMKEMKPRLVRIGRKIHDCKYTRTARILSGLIPYKKIYFRFESFNQSDSHFVRELILFCWIDSKIDSYILFLTTNIFVYTNIFYPLTFRSLKYSRKSPFLVLRNRSTSCSHFLLYSRTLYISLYISRLFFFLRLLIHYIWVLLHISSLIYSAPNY